MKVNGKKYVVTSDFSEEIIPEGFKKGELTFEGSKYSVITQEASGINAMYLTEKTAMMQISICITVMMDLSHRLKKLRLQKTDILSH